MSAAAAAACWRQFCGTAVHAATCDDNAHPPLKRKNAKHAKVSAALQPMKHTQRMPYLTVKHRTPTPLPPGSAAGVLSHFDCWPCKTLWWVKHCAACQQWQTSPSAPIVNQKNFCGSGQSLTVDRFASCLPDHQMPKTQCTLESHSRLHSFVLIVAQPEGDHITSPLSRAMTAVMLLPLLLTSADAAQHLCHSQCMPKHSAT